jgi:hypothetical protein
LPIEGFAWQPEVLEAYGEAVANDGAEGRLVMIFNSAPGAWTSWERHPAGDELVICLIAERPSVAPQLRRTAASLVREITEVRVSAISGARVVWSWAPGLITHMRSHRQRRRMASIREGDCSTSRTGSVE